MPFKFARVIPFGLFLLSFCASLAFAEGPVIRRIVVSRKNVFDTGTPLDRRFPYSWANKLHIVTSERYVRSELLFKEGDALDMETIEDSERVLRRRPIFRYVKITVSEPTDGGVDVFVETEDVWTTNVNLSFNVAGGKSFYSAGFLENNFLGYGKQVGAFIRKDIDRFVRGLSYRDPALLGTKWSASAGYGKDEKGREWESRLERPYRYPRERHSEGGAVHVRDDQDRLFENGEEAAVFDHHTNDVRVFASRAIKPSSTRVRRVSLAHERLEDEFSKIGGWKPPVLPDRRVVSSVLAGFDYQNLRYRKMRGIMTFDRDEDVNFGLTGGLEAGPSTKALGATTDGAVGRGRLMKIFQPGGKNLWFNFINTEARLEKGKIQNGIARVRTQFFLMDWREKNTAWARFDLAASKNLDPESQFLLGGENGLRGYSVRQFGGTNKALLALENRRVVLYDWLHLMSLGWAVFADAGAVWNERALPRSNQIKSDVGAGIRIAPSRSVNPGLIRIDVAYALQDNQRSSRFVLNLGAEISFGERQVKKYEQ